MIPTDNQAKIDRLQRENEEMKSMIVLFKQFMNRERDLIIDLRKNLSEAEAQLEMSINPRLEVACSWCDPKAIADRYYLCDKHKIELKALIY